MYVTVSGFCERVLVPEACRMDVDSLPAMAWSAVGLQPMDRVHTARPVKLLAGCYTGAREDVVSSLLFIDIAVSEFDVQDSKT